MKVTNIKTCKNESKITVNEKHIRKPRKENLCNVCNKKLRSKYHLKLHMTVHTGEKNYICGVCGNGYQQKWNLITHVARVHTKEKPFKCNECGKAFGYSSHFKRHVKIHFLEKIKASETVKKRIMNPHPCTICEKSFETKYRLSLHQRIHTGSRPFVCEKCGKTFTTKRLCRTHLKKLHDLQQDNLLEYNRCFSDSKAENNIVTEFERKTPEKECMKTKTTERVYSENKKKSNAENTTSKTTEKNINFENRVNSFENFQKISENSSQKIFQETQNTGNNISKVHSQVVKLMAHRNTEEKNQHLQKHSVSNRAIQNNTENIMNNKKVLKANSEQSQTTSKRKEITYARAITACQEKTEFGKGCDIELLNINLVEDKSKFTEMLMNTQKSKCTGDETLEDFLKIASSWANKKFQESKSKNVNKVKNVSVDTQTDEIINNRSGEVSFLESVSTKDEIQNQTKVKSKETMTSVVKEVRKNINKIIFNKIIGSIWNAETKIKVSEVVNLLNESQHKDILREFLKIVKKVPDSDVTRTIESQVIWSCWKCESVFKSRHLLGRHLLVHESEENRPYKCEICTKTFTQSNNFKEHVLLHQDKNQFYCEKCGCGFRHRSHFNIHLKRHDDTKAQPCLKKFNCCFCEKKLNTSYQKMEHERTHTKEKPFLCKICGRRFVALPTLRRHNSTHNKSSYQCSTCLKFFKQKSSLTRHIDAHFGQSAKNALCDCGKTFTQFASLKKHKLICKNQTQPVFKPFQCQICQKKFLTKSDLNRHVTTHDPTKKYKCLICSAHLKTKQTFKRHEKRHGYKDK